MVGSYVILVSTAYQNHVDGCQKELRHLTRLVKLNNTTRSMLHHHALVILTHLYFVSKGLTVLVTNCSEDVRTRVVYSLWENSARLILQKHLKLSALISSVQTWVNLQLNTLTSVCFAFVNNLRTKVSGFYLFIYLFDWRDYYNN
jgi:hypothetical protein